MTTPGSWRNPEPRGPYHLLIVGAGPAGLLAALAAVGRGAKVALVERSLLGGICRRIASAALAGSGARVIGLPTTR